MQKNDLSVHLFISKLFDFHKKIIIQLIPQAIRICKKLYQFVKCIYEVRLQIP